VSYPQGVIQRVNCRPKAFWDALGIFSLLSYFDLNAQEFTANIISIVHPLMVMVNAQRWQSCIASLKLRDVGRGRIVMIVRLISEEDHIWLKVEDLIPLSTISGEIHSLLAKSERSSSTLNVSTSWYMCRNPAMLIQKFIVDSWR
jgi:hypothetical protein